MSARFAFSRYSTPSAFAKASEGDPPYKVEGDGRRFTASITALSAAAPVISFTGVAEIERLPRHPVDIDARNAQSA